MRDSVRVTVEDEREEESVRVHDDAGAVTAGDATFRFSVDGAEAPEDPDGGSAAEPPAPDYGDAPRRVAPLSDVPTDTTLRCEALRGRRGTEFILRCEAGTVFAWRNSCPHEPDVPLDPGGGAIVDDGDLVCGAHGARFECGDGHCTYGPCEGDDLDPMVVEVEDGDVYLTDNRFEAARRLD